MAEENEFELLPIGKAAKELGVHQNTLRNWANADLVPYTRLPTGYRRFSRQQIEQIRFEMLQRKFPERERVPKEAA